MSAPTLAAAALLRTILLDLGGDDHGRDSEEHEREIVLLLDYLRHAPGTAIVIVDSAHEMPSETLAVLVRTVVEALRLDVALQVVLVGLPALRENLAQQALLAQLRDVDARHEHLEPLAESDVKSFMEQRWWHSSGGIGALAQAVRTPHLSPAAVRAAFSASLGNQRIVAMLADRLRADGRTPKNGRIGVAAMEHVAAELGLPLVRRPQRRPMWAAAGIAALGVAGIAVGAASLTSGPGPGVARHIDAAPAPITPERSLVAAPEPVAAPVAPPIEQDFAGFRRATLDTAARLSAAPDVRGLMRLEDAAKQWDVSTKHASHAAVADLLTELDRLTNEARERQLIADGRQLRESQSH